MMDLLITEIANTWLLAPLVDLKFFAPVVSESMGAVEIGRIIGFYVVGPIVLWVFIVRRVKKAGTGNRRPGSNQSSNGNEEMVPRDLHEAWALAKSFYPDLAGIERQLQQVSPELAERFCIRLLSEKDYEEREAIASELKHDFFEFRFGTNEEIISFGRGLLAKDRLDEANRLTEIVKVMGSKIDPEKILVKFDRDPPMAPFSPARTPGPKSNNLYEGLSEEARKDVMTIYRISFDGKHYRHGRYISTRLTRVVEHVKLEGSGND